MHRQAGQPRLHRRGQAVQRPRHPGTSLKSASVFLAFSAPCQPVRTACHICTSGKIRNFFKNSKQILFGFSWLFRPAIGRSLPARHKKQADKPPSRLRVKQTEGT
jgi:hypothetical protein